MISLFIGPTEGEETLLLNKETPFLFPSPSSLPHFHSPQKSPDFMNPLFSCAGLYFISWFLCVFVRVCVCVCARASVSYCVLKLVRGRKGVCYLCSGPLSGIEGLSGGRKGPLKECREGGNTLSPAACGKLLPMRRHAFAYDPFSSERKTRCGGILVSLRVSL